MGLVFDDRATPQRSPPRASLEDSLELPRPTEVLDGRYRAHRVIGEGGMAIVLVATHLQLDSLVAVKLLRPEARKYPDQVERFLREGRAAARIRSEHVARVLDVGMGPYGPFLVMEYLRGRDLQTVIQQDGPLSVERAVDYVLQACEAIAEAHAAGVIHRDLKPANLFLSKRADHSECIKVLDFGISKLTSEGAGRLPARATDPSLLMGSPPYMSPEQARSPRDVDTRTDIWALGATLYELLAGEPPFGLGPSPMLLMRALRRRFPPVSTLRADVPPALDAAIARCLAVNPRDRYSSVTELARAIAGSGSSSARTSARRIARISGSKSGWEVPARAARPRGGTSVCAMDLVEPRRRERDMGRARWGGYLTAIALVGLTFAFVIWRYGAAFREEAQAAAEFAPRIDEPAPFVELAPREESAPREPGLPSIDLGDAGEAERAETATSTATRGASRAPDRVTRSTSLSRSTSRRSTNQ